MAKHPIGVRPWKGAWQAYVRVAGKLIARSFPLHTPLDEMKRWRLAHKLATPRTRSTRTFEADVKDYLARVSAMPTYQQRQHHLEIWLDALGRTRPRHTITTAEIDRVMQGWLTAKLAPDTVRKRRTSLLSLFVKLDGKAAPNPVHEAKPPKAAPPTVRGLDATTLQRVLASLPPSKTAARLRVMAWTGLPPGMLMAVTPEDVNLKKAELRIAPRRKGAGSPARVLPLAPQAVKAFRELRDRQAFGPFGVAPAGLVLKRACRRCHVPEIRLYDLRHSFGAMLYRTTKDLPTVSRFLLHASLASTARYAMGAVADIDRAAAKALKALSE